MLIVHAWMDGTSATALNCFDEAANKIINFGTEIPMQ